jgi:hypothetical protein
MFGLSRKEKSNRRKTCCHDLEPVPGGMIGLVIEPRLAFREIYKDLGGGRVGKQRFRSCHRLCR